MDTTPTSLPQVPTRVLVIGPDAAASTSTATGAGVHTIFLDWQAWAALSDADPDASCEYLEMDAERREIEADAWRWACDVAPVAARATGHSGEHAERVALVTRRIVQHGIGFAAARARRTAAAVANRVPAGAEVRTDGLDPLTAAFLAELVADAPPPPVARPSLLPGVSAPFARSLRGSLRHARHASQRSRARAAARSLAETRGPLVGFVTQAIRDEAIAGPAVALLRDRGHAVVKVDLSTDGRTLSSSFTSDLTVDGRDWVDPYPLGILARFAVRRSAAVRSIEADLPEQLAPVAGVFAADVAAHAGVTAPTLLSRAGRVLDDLACERLVLLGETNRIVTPLTCMAEARNIPVTCVQHGIIHDIPQWAAMPFSTFAVYGPAYAEVLTSLGTPSAHVVVTGDPRLDRAVAAQPPRREDVLASLGLNATEPRRLVTFAANYTSHRLSGSSMERAFGALIGALASMPEALLVVKLHPQGAGRELPYERVLARNPELAHAIAPRDSRLIDLIAISDVVTVHVSSVGFEAAAMGKPLVVINPDDGIQEVPFVREGIGREGRSAVEVRQLLDDAFAGRFGGPDPGQLARFNERYNGPLDGRATERLADAIMASRWG
ncbi:MAG: hypothetical protein U1E26_09190 [Coriobacteriia bacterium]|nr:hypothetical protein [Coriobacteriia bacterium]